MLGEFVCLYLKSQYQVKLMIYIWEERISAIIYHNLFSCYDFFDMLDISTVLGSVFFM